MTAAGSSAIAVPRASGRLHLFMTGACRSLFKLDTAVEIRRISQSILLLCADANTFSPVTDGRRLLERLPNARIHVAPGGNHDLAHVHALQLAPLIDVHLMQSPFERC